MPMDKLFKNQKSCHLLLISGNFLFQNLYDMLLNMLEERGVDADFIDQMVEYCTGYEHQRYVGFLQGLKDFAASK